jgi:hypothetical protein
MRALHIARALACLLAGCTSPPSASYIGGSAASAGTAKGVALGNATSGESCLQLPSDVADAIDVYCGTWQSPAARIRFQLATTATPEALATGGAWREALDLRYACAPPVGSNILDGTQAELRRCTRRIGGWPRLGLVASVGDRVYLADGILPTLPGMERAIAVLSGRVAAGTAALPPSATTGSSWTRASTRRCPAATSPT